MGNLKIKNLINAQKINQERTRNILLKHIRSVERVPCEERFIKNNTELNSNKMVLLLITMDERSIILFYFTL